MSDIEFLFGIKRKRLDDGKNLSRNYSQGERVHGINGISPCLSSQMGGTANGSVLVMELKPKVICNTDVNRGQDNWNGPRDGYQVYDTQGIAPALRVSQKDLKIMENKAGRDISYCLDSNYHKGTNTTEKSRRQLVLERHTVAYSKSTRDNHIDVRGKVNGESNTISTGDGGSNQSTQNFVAETDDSLDIRIRKLTPVECERLMKWPDNHTKYGQLPDGKIYELSNSARYKACGNGIVSTVPLTILEALIKDTQVRVFSTFSGVDGSTLLLPSDKYIKVAFSEFDPQTKQQHAANVLRYHNPNVINLGDITKIQIQDVPDHDLIFISAPCQTFSIAGKRAGLEDTKGTLFYETARIMAEKRPKYFLFENVKGLLSHNKGRTFEIMCEVYSSLGYDIDFELVNAKYYGCAQNRERVFMFGVRRDP